MTPPPVPDGLPHEIHGIDLMADELHASILGDTLTVTIDRPEKRNAITSDGYHGIKRAAMIVADEPRLQFLVITGTGDAFCAGGDMGRSAPSRRWDMFTESADGVPFETLGRIPKIVVCKINGIAMGGGMVMSMYADLVIASDEARIRIPDLTRGVYEAFIAARLPQRVGTLRANHLMYESEWLTPQQALEIGLVGRVVPHADLDAETEAMIERVRKTGPVARALMKRQMWQSLPPVDVGGYWERIGTPETAEAWTAFLDKRDPQWPGTDDPPNPLKRSRRATWMPTTDDTQ
jgi:enoyl-CoA hydratase/carnithine racemase